MRYQPPSQPPHQRTQRRQLKQLRRLIQRRLTQQRLIPIVKTRQLRAHHQDRDPRNSSPRQTNRPPRELHRQHKRTNNRNHIRHHQQPPKQRIPPQTRRRTTNLRNPTSHQPTTPPQPQKPTRTTKRPRIGQRRPRIGQRRRSPDYAGLCPTPRLHTHSASRLLARHDRTPHGEPTNPNRCRDSVTPTQVGIINTMAS